MKVEITFGEDDAIRSKKVVGFVLDLMTQYDTLTVSGEYCPWSEKLPSEVVEFQANGDPVAKTNGSSNVDDIEAKLDSCRHLEAAVKGYAEKAAESEQRSQEILSLLNKRTDTTDETARASIKALGERVDSHAADILAIRRSAETYRNLLDKSQKSVIERLSRIEPTIEGVKSEIWQGKG